MTCINTPIGNSFCYDSLALTDSSTGAKVSFGLQVSVTMVELTIGTAGLYILISVVGATLGFWAKQRITALIGTAILTFIVSILIGIVIVPEVALRAVFQPFNPLTLFAVLLMALMPFSVAFGLVELTSSLVRRPA